MKFSEKLVNLRKQNKMSQEQLASMLDVSRQAVSKWESGTTYPEMDKLITMCKIFKCSLDDLTNDEILDINFEEKKKSNFLFDTLDLVVKTLDMFKCMSFKQIIGCFFQMGILFIILLIIKLPVDYIIYLGQRVFMRFDFVPGFDNVWYLLVTIAYVAISFVTFVYVFKCRYLDKFEYTTTEKISNKEEQTTIMSSTNHPLEYRVIKDNKSNGFFRVLGVMALTLIKATILFMLLPFIITFVGLFAALIVIIILLFHHVIYIGVILGVIFGILLNYVILELGYDFIFNKRPAVKRIFIMLMIAIAGIGISLGIFAYEVSITEFIDESPLREQTEVIKEYDMTDKLYIYNWPMYNVEYIINETLTDKVIIETRFHDKYLDIDIKKYDDGIDIRFLDVDNSLHNKELLEYLIKDLSHKKIHNYNDLYDYRIIITSNEKNIDKIRTNNEKKRLEEQKQYQEERKDSYERQIDQYEQEITELNNKINKLNNDIDTLEETKSSLQTEINNYKEKIKEYQANLNNLLEE